MNKEKRSHRRVKTKKLKADVHSFNDDGEEIPLDAKILDISRSGIRIRLSRPLRPDMGTKLRITMQLPDSGQPFTVHGKLQNQHTENEYGLHYTDHVDGSVDDILFEFVKMNDFVLLIKST
jgi:PilZ domain-containing protein